MMISKVKLLTKMLTSLIKSLVPRFGKRLRCLSIVEIDSHPALFEDGWELMRRKIKLMTNVSECTLKVPEGE